MARTKQTARRTGKSKRTTLAEKASRGSDEKSVSTTEKIEEMFKDKTVTEVYNSIRGDGDLLEKVFAEKDFFLQCLLEAISAEDTKTRDYIEKVYGVVSETPFVEGVSEEIAEEDEVDGETAEIEVTDGRSVHVLFTAEKKKRSDVEDKEFEEFFVESTKKWNEKLNLDETGLNSDGGHFHTDGGNYSLSSLEEKCKAKKAKKALEERGVFVAENPKGMRFIVSFIQPEE